MYNIPIFKDRESIDTKKLVAVARKLLPDVVFNMASLEGNPFTYPEVQTLLDGVTVGGHRLSDHEQIMRIKDSWECIFDLVMKGDWSIDEDLFFLIHEKVATGEALEVGKFRTGQVHIGGTDYMPPAPEELLKLFVIQSVELQKQYKENKTALAIALFLWGARQQFFWDGNKRTARLVANLILISSGQGILNIKNKDRLEFNSLMIEFYNTGDGKKVAEFLYNKCIDRV